MILTEQKRTEQDRTGLTFSKLILFTLLFALFAAPGWAAEGDVSYIYYEPAPDGMSATKHTDGVKHNNEYKVINDNDTDVNWEAGWYVVNTDVTIGSRIIVSGTVNLILCDGATLIAEKGITVTSDDTTGNTLNIYGQTNGTGQLEATGDKDAAGIGGNSGDSECYGGTVTIYGGTVTATGGDGAQGIGGGTGDKGLGAPAR